MRGEKVKDIRKSEGCNKDNIFSIYYSFLYSVNDIFPDQFEVSLCLRKD